MTVARVLWTRRSAWSDSSGTTREMAVKCIKTMVILVRFKYK